MRNTSHRLIYFLCIILVITGCKKDENPSPPVILLAAGTGYTQSGAVVAVGGKLRFGISASGKDANITNFVVKKIMPDGSSKVMLDSGLNSSSFTVSETFFQSVEQEARWTFQVMDKNRQFGTAAITIYKDPASVWGGIYEFPVIKLGYQQNNQFGHFLVPSTGNVWFADTAFIHQDLIDIIAYYYEDGTDPSPTFSSAGETGGGITEYYPEINSWTTKRYTKWDISVDANPIPVVDFEACHNDSLLIMSYDDVWGKRKFKYAYPDVVIPFLTASGKKGLIRVLSSDNDPAGTISFSIKIQL